MKQLGLNPEDSLTRSQANFRLKAKYYESEFNKAITASGSGIAGTVIKSIGGALSAALLDPVFLIASAGISIGVSTALKASKLLPLIQQSSTAARLGTKAALYGGADAALNVQAGKIIADAVENPYTDLNLFVDAAVGVVFGVAFSPGIKLSKVDRVIQQASEDLGQVKQVFTPAQRTDINNTTPISSSLIKYNPTKTKSSFDFSDFSKVIHKHEEYYSLPLKTLKADFNVKDLISTLHTNLNLLKTLNSKYDDIFSADFIRLNLNTKDDIMHTFIDFLGVPREAFTSNNFSFINSVGSTLNNLSKHQASVLEWFVRAEQGPQMFEAFTQYLMRDTEAAKIFSNVVEEASRARIYSTDDFISLFHRHTKNISESDIIYDATTIKQLDEFKTSIKQRFAKGA